MQVVELVGGTLALSMKVLEDVNLVQPLKATSGEKTARPGSHGVVASRKLHCLARPAHSGVSAPAERPRDAEIEVGGQRPADAEAGGPRPSDTGGQRSEGQRDPESELGGPRLARSGPELEDK